MPPDFSFPKAMAYFGCFGNSGARDTTNLNPENPVLTPA